jgi:hypothetical protein
MAGRRYQRSPKVPGDDGRWIDDHINPANRAEAKRIFALLDSDYIPIDWQLDFKSGYRWSERTWYKDIEFTQLPEGIDIKVPWELARMQHLPLLAWAYLCASRDRAGFGEPERFQREFRNQILDFIATNPPRFGVNWYYSMEVGLRVANWVVGYDLFRRFGASFDPEFELILGRSVHAHAKHIFNNLENTGSFKGNHYLSNVVGLMFASAALPEIGDRKDWLGFAVQEFVAEVASQFNSDGSNFEASTSYHCLSAEMVNYATALLAGISKERQKTPTRLSISDWSPPNGYLEKLVRMAQFIGDHSKPDGTLVQFGDNDSGRFLKLDPLYLPLPVSEVKAKFENLRALDCSPESGVYWLECQLDRTQITDAAKALWTDYEEHRGSLGAWYVDQLCRGSRFKAPVTCPASQVSIRRWEALERQYDNHPQAAKKAWRVIGFKPDLQSGIRLRSYPDFGSYVYCSDRVHLVVRCGAIGQKGIGGHAHNDQLSFDLVVDEEHIFTDPGTYIYTASPGIRNRYRSLRSHNGPQVRRLERGTLDLGLFRLSDTTGTCLHASELRFAGCYDVGSSRVYRMLEIRSQEIFVRDWVEGSFYGWNQPTETPVSPGYGWVFRQAAQSARVEIAR